MCIRDSSWGTAFTDIEWTTSINVIGYILSIGTTAGGIDIINALDVGNVTTFNLPNDLPENTKIFITVIPYNLLGEAVWCIEEQFRTCPRFKAGFKIPKFFTPNGDGFQDEWFVTDPDNSITRIVIFDRFGKTLFTGNGSSRWDGIYNNIPMQPMDIGAL